MHRQIMNKSRYKLLVICLVLGLALVATLGYAFPSKDPNMLRSMTIPVPPPGSLVIEVPQHDIDPFPPRQDPPYNPDIFPLKTAIPEAAPYALNMIAAPYVPPALPDSNSVLQTAEYRNDRMGFRFRYPSVLPTTPGGILHYDFSSAPSIPADSLFLGGYCDPVRCLGAVLDIRNASSVTLDATRYIAYSGYPFDMTAIERVDAQRFVLGTAPAYRALVYLKGNSDIPYREYIYLIRRSRLYTTWFDNTPENQLFKAYFLNTLEFLD